MPVIRSPISAAFQGIAFDLQIRYPNNWKNYIQIIPSSINSEHEKNGDIYNMLNYSYNGVENYDNWCSDYHINSSFTLFFPKFKIIPNIYSLQSKTTHVHFPSKWCVEGSLDNHSWTHLETYENIFSDHNQNFSFEIEHKEIVKYVRFTQLKSSNNQAQPSFCLRRVEIYGYIIQNHIASHSHFFDFNVYKLIFIIFSS